MKASGYTTDTSPFHIQSEGVKGFRFLFCRQPWKVNFAFLQFQLLRQTSFIWYFDLPYFFSWLNYYIDVYIVFPSQWWTFRATNPAGQVSRFGSGCVLLLRVIMWLLLRHDSACKTYGSCFFVGNDICWYIVIDEDIWYMITYHVRSKLLKIRWPQIFGGDDREGSICFPNNSTVGITSKLIALAPGSHHAASLWNGEPTDGWGDVINVDTKRHFARNGWKWWVWDENWKDSMDFYGLD